MQTPAVHNNPTRERVGPTQGQNPLSCLRQTARNIRHRAAGIDHRSRSPATQKVDCRGRCVTHTRIGDHDIGDLSVSPARWVQVNYRIARRPGPATSSDLHKGRANVAAATRPKAQTWNPIASRCQNRLVKTNVKAVAVHHRTSRKGPKRTIRKGRRDPCWKEGRVVRTGDQFAPVEVHSRCPGSRDVRSRGHDAVGRQTSRIQVQTRKRHRTGYPPKLHRPPCIVHRATCQRHRRRNARFTQRNVGSRIVPNHRSPPNRELTIAIAEQNEVARGCQRSPGHLHHRNGRRRNRCARLKPGCRDSPSIQEQPPVATAPDARQSSGQGRRGRCKCPSVHDNRTHACRVRPDRVGGGRVAAASGHIKKALRGSRTANRRRPQTIVESAGHSQNSRIDCRVASVRTDPGEGQYSSPHLGQAKRPGRSIGKSARKGGVRGVPHGQHGVRDRSVRHCRTHGTR